MTRQSDGQRVDTPAEATEPTVSILNLAADVLRESWMLLPLLHYTSNYGIEPKDINKHWRRQSELQYTLLNNWRHISDVTRRDCESLQLQTDMYQFLNNEMDFLSAFQKVLQVAVVDDNDECLHHDVQDVLTHVNNALISVSEKLGLATKLFNPVSLPVATVESDDAKAHNTLA